MQMHATQQQQTATVTRNYPHPEPDATPDTARREGPKPRKTNPAKAADPPRIVARIRRPDGEVYWVTSRSHPERLHRVEVKPGRLVCGCPASVYTGRCAHRQVVHDLLADEAQARALLEELHETQAAIADTGVILRRCQAKTAAMDTTAAARETAMLRRSNEPFSMLRK